jgi:hypothetical protein
LVLCKQPYKHWLSASFKRENEVLLREAASYGEDVKGNFDVLLKNGLDEKLLETF